MDETTLHRKLSELIQEIGAGASDSNIPVELEAVLAETSKGRRHTKETISAVQEAIDYLRLQIKYMRFDLVATRRENQQLRKMLDEQGRGGE